MTKRLLILAMVAALSSCASKDPSKRSQDPSAARGPAKATYIDNVSMAAGVQASGGKAAANFSWTNDMGKKVSLSSLKGKTVLINFWATWCGPCKEELPDIETISKQYASKGLVVIGVSEDQGPGLLKDVSGFAQKHGLSYQIVIDNNDIANAYGGINAIPTSFLVNKDGKIVKKWIGLRGKSFFESTVRDALD